MQLAELRPEPLGSVAVEDPGLGANGVEMIYVVDVRNGLYVLRYHGRWVGQVDDESFLEGNSNL